MPSDFSLFKKKNKKGYTWYVRFYNPNTKKYDISRSTGVSFTGRNQKKNQAILKAQEILENLNFETPLFMTDYVLSFWKRGSQYEKMKRLLENNPLSPDYIRLMHNSIIKHVIPYPPFKNKLITDLTPGIIDDWKLWALERGTGRVQLNSTLKALKVPIRYLISRGEIAMLDPFYKIRNISVMPREKGILTKDEILSILSTKYKDPRIYFAVLLSILSGLRRGELRGLLWKDLDAKKMLIKVEHNYIDSEGLKPCKCGSNRVVLLPKELLTTIESIKDSSPYTQPDDYVLYSIDNSKRPNDRTKPISNFSIRYGFHNLLKKSGIPIEQQKKRNLTLHGMRHTFVTMARLAGIPDIAVQALAGHKSADMMNHYSHGSQVVKITDYRSRFEEIYS